MLYIRQFAAGELHGLTYYDDHGIFATVGFGCIGFTVATKNFIVLEDGQQLLVDDFSNVNCGSTLKTVYGIPSTAVSKGVSSDMRYLWVTGAISDLPASLTSQYTAPTGYPATAPLPLNGSVDGIAATGNYHIIADKYMMRLYLEVATTHGNIAVPVLWRDRFNHWVKFTWVHSALPSSTGMDSIEKVTVVNQNGLGVVVRWANYLDTTAEPVDILRADFTGFCAPSLFVSGYPGAGEAPTGISLDTYPYSKIVPVLTAGMVARPTTVTVATSSKTPTPSWDLIQGAAAAVGPSVSSSLDVDVAARQWVMSYYKGLDISNTYDALSSILDPGQVVTKFSYNPIFLSTILSVSTNVTRQWAVSKVVQEDTSQSPHVYHTTTWDRIFPYTTDGTNWSSGSWTVKIKDGFLSDDTVPTDRAETYTYQAPKGNMLDYTNGFLVQRVTSDADGKAWSTTTCVSHTLPRGGTYKNISELGGGIDHSLSMPSSTTLTRNGEATITESFTYKNGVALQVSESVQSVNGTPFLTQDYTYNDMGGMLEARQVAGITTTRWALSPTTVTNVWDTSSLLQLRATFLNASATLQHGTTYAYSTTGLLTTQGTWHLESSSSQSTSPITTFGYESTYGQRDWSYTQYADYTSTGAASTSSMSKRVTARDEGGRPKSVKGEDDVITSYTYDIFGRTCSISRSGISDVSIKYDDSALTVTRTQGSIKTITYLDGFGRTIKQDLADGTKVNYDYDAHGRLLHTTKVATDGTSSVTSTTTYDILDRPVTQVDFSGVKVSYVYATDGQGKNMVTRGFGDGSVYPSTSYYDAFGQLVRFVAANGDITTT